MDRELVAIVNGAAGGGRCRSRFDAALDRLRHHHVALDVHFTTEAGHATEIAREAYATGKRQFLSVGGDGTAFEVVNGLFPRAGDSGDVTLGILPLGTGNSFLRDFGIRDEHQALDALVAGKEKTCDVVRAKHRDGVTHYINILSIGFGARVGSLTNQRFKPLGPAGYVLAVFVGLARLEHATFGIRFNGGSVDRRPCVLWSFCNSQYTGGTMWMAPHASVSDGELDVIRVGELGRIGTAAALPKLFKGTHVRMAGIEERRASRVEFEDMPEQNVLLDGEIVRMQLESLEVLPGALRVIA